MKADITIIGGGIVGVALGYTLAQRVPDRKILLLEKEISVGFHQSSHNSGVLHSGIYYKPGSLKAQNCVRGYGRMLFFCQQHGIPHEICGKLIVASTPEELPQLTRLKERAEQNGLKGVRLLSPEEAHEYEPHLRSLGALHVPQAGIVDYKAVVRKLAELFMENGGQVLCSQKVVGIRPGVIETEQGLHIETKKIVNAAGLYSDRIARLARLKLKTRIIPFRGEYYKLSDERAGLVRNLIYPVPNPEFPFLGVHFTRMIEGGVEAGPNAVLAMAREGYTWADWNLGELMDTLAWPGFYKLAMRYPREGFHEVMRSLMKSRFTRALQQMIPEVTSDDLLPASAGVRAQAVTMDGRLADDFILAESEGAVHVLNAPSPAATSSLSIATTLADMILAT